MLLLGLNRKIKNKILMSLLWSLDFFLGGGTATFGILHYLTYCQNWSLQKRRFLSHWNLVIWPSSVVGRSNQCAAWGTYCMLNSSWNSCFPTE